MRTKSAISLFFVVAVVFSGLATAWEFPSFQIPLVPSWLGGRVMTTPPDLPQFILDSQHPWLITHARDLSKLDDPTAIFCTPLDTVLAEHANDPPIDCGHDLRLDGLDVPEDFFARLEIDNNRAGISRHGWSNARDRLVEMKACPRALEAVRELNVDIWVHRGGPFGSDMSPEPALPPDDLPGLFAEVLGSMKGLKKLDWEVRGFEENEVLGKAFTESGTRLEALEEVTASLHAPWLLEISPSLKIARTAAGRRKPWQSQEEADRQTFWLETAGRVKGLKGVDLSRLGWERGMAELVLKELPEIEELWVGHIGEGHYDSVNGEALNSTMTTLSSLEKLKKLHLPTSSELELGFDGGPWCGNAYDGPGGAALYESVRLQNVEATERAGAMVREKMPRLKGVDVGGFYGNFTVDAAGEKIIAWPWTGRLNEWLRETD